jgi:thiol peroxidase
MAERPNAITFKGNPMTLVGAADGLTVGQPAPDISLIATDLSEKKLSDYRGKVVILSTVPSIDTGVCDTQTRTFNEKAGQIDDVVVVTTSMDLPFAFKRWCGAAGVENVVCLSDYKTHNFAEATGLRIEELGLFARSVSVIDPNGTVVYHELVPEVTEQPSYDDALEAAKSAKS